MGRGGGGWGKSAEVAGGRARKRVGKSAEEDGEAVGAKGHECSEHFGVSYWDRYRSGDSRHRG